ncbi:MAG TPA: hypothetical protein VEW25_09605 [Allosphingosinicella sp.]|nr:hypothetical protein [Allosphingosinicella sp.]
MNALTWIHIAGGAVALLAGALAAGARKGGRLHAGAGIWFAVAMLVLGASASVLAQARGNAGLGLGGMLTCYFVATSWVTARRRDGATGKFEIAAGALALLAAAAIAWAGWTGEATTPAGAGPVYLFAAMCLLAGIGDLRAALRRTLRPAQRLSRHLWRMCFAFFIATGSFFLGQQDVMPAAVRGSPILFVLAFAPFALMLFWLVRLRFAKAIARSKASGLISIGRHPQPLA